MNEPVPVQYSTREGLLNLLASYLPGGHERVAAIAEELQLRTRGGFSAPEKILIVLFASRAGSNYLGQLLSSTGWFREIGESFSPGQLTKIRDRYGLRDFREAAQWMIDQRGTPAAFGLKAGFQVLMSAAETGFLPEVIDRAQFVLLRRRDRIAQAVSLVKGKLNGQMHSQQPIGRILSDADFDGPAIAAQIVRIKEREAQYADLAGKLGKTAPVHYYEDICDDPQRHVAAICNQLELDMPPDYTPQVRLSVLRDDLSERWVQRFRDQSGGGE